MAKRSVDTGIAGRVFRVQKMTNGGVPGDVMASARRIMEGNGSKTDVEKCRNFLGISRSGAGAMRSQTRLEKSVIQEAGNIASGIDMISRGNIGGAAQIGSSIQKTVASIVKTKEFESAVIRAAQAVTGDAGIGGVMAGTRATYAIRRGVRMAGAIAARATVVAGLGMELAAGSDFLNGRTETTAGRKAAQAARLASVDYNMSREDRRIIEQRAFAQKIEDESNDMFGFATSHFRKKKYGVDEANILRNEVSSAFKKSGLGNEADLDAAYVSAHTEALREGFGGESVGRLLNKIGMGATADGKEASGKVLDRIKSAQQLKQAMIEASERRDFTAARVLAAEANKEVPGTIPDWMTPQFQFKQKLGNDRNEAVWSRLQMTRSGPRDSR